MQLPLWFLFLLHHWRWLVEVLLLSCAVYGVYRLTRGTRGAAVLTGLGILIGAMWFLTVWLELHVIGSVLVVVLQSLPVILVVLLQQEMRQGLGGLSWKHFFSSKQSKAEVVEGIVGAAESLSQKRLGALIAIEHNNNHQGVIESGVPVDAVVSEELLESIFYPNTPLHDGGAWIHNNRLVAAACIFPVTDRETLHRSLGLRHRAAIGLTEECDAPVVVVSEETGIISLVHQGLIERPMSPESLRRRLTDILMDRTRSLPKDEEAVA